MVQSCRGMANRMRLPIGLPSPSFLAEFRLSLVETERGFNIHRLLAQRKSCLISQGTDVRRHGGKMLDETTSRYTSRLHNTVRNRTYVRQEWADGQIKST